MKKLFFYVFLAVLFAGFEVSADDFFGDIIVSEELKEDARTEKSLQEGQITAGKILDSKPIVLKIDKVKGRIKETTKEIIEPIVRESAPFGLKWLATIDEIRYLNVRLQPKEIKDMPNTFTASNLPKPVSVFREVLVSFGENDSLWRISAYGKRVKDDSRASKGVAEYNKYYEMLSKKYGNAQEFYTPAVVNVEEKISSDDGTSSIAVRQQKMSIGADGFLQKLMSGEAVLYATFETSRLGITLALLADGQGQTYIVVDYKNLVKTQIENEELFDAL